jgi:hypothetical protein
VGDAFSSAGLVVAAVYDDGSSATITGWTLSWNNADLADGNTAITAATGTKTVAVAYEGASASFAITVKAAGVALTGISIASQPTKTTYTVGEAFSSAGLSVSASYGDGSAETVTGWTLSWNNASLSEGSTAITAATGAKTVTVSYEGKSAIFTLTVKADVQALDSIDAVTAYLSSASGGMTADDPIPLAVALAIPTNWFNLLTAIGRGDRYVDLDLSECTMTVASQGVFTLGITSSSAAQVLITALTLPEGATRIEKSNATFASFTSLRSVNGDTIETIGSEVFSECEALTTVSFPAVTSIPAGTSGYGSSVFRGCTALTTVDLPALTSIGEYTFYGFSSLITANFPVATTIGASAFRGCSALTTVSLPVATSIGTYAFSGCAALTTVSLPTAASIGAYAFYYCGTLTTVSLPAATSIGAYAFSGSALTTVTLPAVTSIGSYAFSGSILTTVRLPAATSIGERAFEDSTALETADFPLVTSIGQYAFSGCTALTTVSFPAVTSIPAGELWFSTSVFRGCTALTTVDFPAVTSIGSSTFRGISSLTTVNFPAATSIDESAFRDCTALTTVSLPAATSIGDSAFHTCSSLTTADFPAVTSIGFSAFSGCAALTTVSLPAATDIGTSTFSDCGNLTTVSLPTATSIGDSAFSYCVNLTTVSLSAVTSIGSNAFYDTGTAALTIDLPKAAPMLGWGSGSGDTYTKSVTVRTPPDKSGYDSWEANFKSAAFGYNATITLTFTEYTP